MERSIVQLTKVQKNSGILKILLPVPPITNARLQGTVRKSKAGKRYAGFRQSDASKAYQAEIKLKLMQSRMKPISGDLSMTLIWFRARFETVSRKKKGDTVTTSKRFNCSGDVPDRWKDLCDGLQGFAYHNDKQIRDFRALAIDTEPHNPRVCVIIKPVQEKDLYNEAFGLWAGLA